MGQHFTLGAGPAQIMGQHVLPRLYGCRLWPPPRPRYAFGRAAFTKLAASAKGVRPY